ncbi:immunoglobulin I-set domain-containing protein, partial [Aphelenchoides avenae]
MPLLPRASTVFLLAIISDVAIQVSNGQDSTPNFFVAESPFSGWSNDDRYRVVQEDSVGNDVLGDNNAFRTGSTDPSRPHFHPGPWGECSASCGPGVRTRSVECVAYQGITVNVVRLPDYECDGQTKPALFQPCQISTCPLSDTSDVSEQSSKPANLVSTDSHQRGRYRWDYGEWGSCSASCLGGKQKSTLKCVDISRKTSVPWSYCDAKQRPVDLSRPCNNHPCPPAWDVGEFSTCSHTCGGGIRTRKVRCIRRVSRVGGAESTLILPESQCPQPVPQSQEPCGLVNCPPNWRVDQWSACSTSCGSGEQRRTVVCEMRDSSGSIRTFNPPEECGGLERPPTVQLCYL